MLNHVVLQVMGFLFVIIVKIEEQIDEKITDKQDLIKALIFITVKVAEFPKLTLIHGIPLSLLI